MKTTQDDTYARKSLPSQWAIERNIHSLKFELNTSLIQHFEKFNDLIISLSTAKGEEIKEDDVVGKLLQSLPNEYSQVAISIETMNEDTPITLDFVKNRLLNHETKLKEMMSDTSSKALVSNVIETMPQNHNRNTSSRQRGGASGIKENLEVTILGRGKDLLNVANVVVKAMLKRIAFTTKNPLNLEEINHKIQVQIWLNRYKQMM